MAVIDLNNLFPEPFDGSDRRPLPKQKEFLDYAIDPKGPEFIAYYGGYGCLAEGSLIHTQRGLVPIEQIRVGDSVKTSFDSFVPVVGAIPKGKDHLYRVTHERGEFVASEAHLVYVAPGEYRHVFDLKPGDNLCLTSPHDSIEESSPSTSALDAQSLIQTSVNYLDRCLACYHQHGQLPQEVKDNVQGLIPLLVDVLGYTPISERKGVLQELALVDNHPDQWLTLLDKTRSTCLSDLLAGVSEDYSAALASGRTSAEDSASLLLLLTSLLRRTGLLQTGDRVPLVSQVPSRILSVEKQTETQWYYDLEVLSSGHYVDSNGIVHHNSGKSLILCIVNIIWGVMYGGEYVIARQFMPELRRTTLKLFKDLLPKELLLEERVADAQFRIRSMKGEALFHFVGLDEPGKLDSLTLDGVSIDEASQTSEEAMLKLQGRLRGPRGLRKMLLVGNPKGHDFVYRYFIKQDNFRPFKDPVSKRTISVEEQKAKYKLIIAPSTENVFLPPNYVAQMLATYSDARIQRDIMGSFDAFQGQVFDEFRRDVHVVAPFDIPKDWTIFCGLDVGYTNPTACVFCAMDYDGTIWIFKEFYQSEWIIKEIVNGREGEPGLKQLAKGYKLDGIWIDPSSKANRGKDSDFTTYLEEIPKDWSLIPANNDVSYGIDRIKTLLKPQGRLNRPKLFIFNTCTNVIDEMVKYRWKELTPGVENSQNQKEEPVKKDEHSVDACRYAICSRPEQPKPANTLAPHLQSTLSGSVQKELKELKNNYSSKDPWGEKYEQDPGFTDEY